MSYFPGTRTVLFEMSGATLTENMQYTATLTTDIKDTNTNALESNFSWTFTTGTGESSGVHINRVKQESAVDTNGDGLYDKLRFTVVVEATEAGTYNLNGQLTDSDGEDIAWKSADMTGGVGGDPVVEVQLEFEGSDIGAHGQDGPYTLGNLYIYKTSDSSVYHEYSGSYTTYPYSVDDFYTIIRLNSIPDLGVASNSSHPGILDLESYAFHATENVGDLNYRLLINSDPRVGATIDASASHHLDVEPSFGFTGYSDITLELKDSSNRRALQTFRISVQGGLQLAGPGWHLISLSQQPADTAIASVLAAIAGKYDAVWAYENGAWVGYFPNNPGGSNLALMEAGKGYWIHTTEACDLSSLGGSVEGQVVNLVQNWNLVGYNSLTPQPVASALASIAGRYLSVWYYEDGVWKVYDPNNPGFSDLETMVPGYGYWINSIMDTPWTLP